MERGGMEYQIPMAKERGKKQMKEGKVIKIMRRRWGEGAGWCGEA